MESTNKDQPTGSVRGKLDIFDLLTSSPGEDYTAVRHGEPLTTIATVQAYEARLVNNAEPFTAYAVLGTSLLDPLYLEARGVLQSTSLAGVVIAGPQTPITIAASSTNVFNIQTTREPSRIPVKTGAIKERAMALNETPLTVSARVGAMYPALGVPTATLDWLGLAQLCTTAGLNLSREFLTLYGYKAAYNWMAMPTPQLSRLIADSGINKTLKEEPAQSVTLANVNRLFMPPTAVAGALAAGAFIPPGVNHAAGGAGVANPANFWSGLTNTRPMNAAEAVVAAGAYSFPGGYSSRMRFLTSAAFVPGQIRAANIIMVPGALFGPTAEVNQTLLALWVAAFFPCLANVAILADVTEEYFDTNGPAPVVKPQAWLPTTNANNIRYQPRSDVLVVLPTLSTGAANDPHVDAVIRPQYGPTNVAEFGVAAPAIIAANGVINIAGGIVAPGGARAAYANVDLDVAAYIASHAVNFTPDLINEVETRLAAVVDMRGEALDLMAGVAAKISPQVAMVDYAETVTNAQLLEYSAVNFSTVTTGSYNQPLPAPFPAAQTKAMVTCFRNSYLGPDLRYRDQVTDNATRTLFLAEGDSLLASAIASGFITAESDTLKHDIPSKYMDAMSTIQFTATLSAIALSQALYVDAFFKESPLPVALLNMRANDIAVGCCMPLNAFKPIWSLVAKSFEPTLRSGAIEFGGLLTSAAQTADVPFKLAYAPTGFIARRSVPTEIQRAAGFYLGCHIDAAAAAMVSTVSPLNAYARLGFAPPTLLAPVPGRESSASALPLVMRHPGIVPRSWWKAWRGDTSSQTRQIDWWDAMDTGPGNSVHVDDTVNPVRVKIRGPSAMAINKATVRESLVLGKFFSLAMNLASYSAEYAAVVDMLLDATQAVNPVNMAVVATAPPVPVFWDFPAAVPESAIGSLNQLEYASESYIRYAAGYTSGKTSHLHAGLSAMFLSLTLYRPLAASLQYPRFTNSLRTVHYPQMQLMDTVPRLLDTTRPIVIVDNITAETLDFDMDYFKPSVVAPPPKTLDGAGEPDAEKAARAAAELAQLRSREDAVTGAKQTTIDDGSIDTQ